MLVLKILTDPALVRLLLHGGVGVVPTDTVYGLVARAADKAAVARLYALKKREHKPGTTIAASVEQLLQLGIDAKDIKSVQHLWPNPVSVLLSPGPNYAYLHAGLGTSPFRVVADPSLRALLEATGPLLTSSANQPGEPPATNLSQAQAYFGEQVDFYVDGGELGERPPSTIIRLTASGQIEVIRQGAVTISPEGRAPS
jgi:L-threonylcarbamoyladenylate synthase